MSKFLDRLFEISPEALLEQLVGHHIAVLVGGFSGNVAANLIAGGLVSAFALTGGYLGARDIPARLKAHTISETTGAALPF